MTAIGPLIATPSAASSQAVKRDRIEGLWAGVAGPPQDRIPVAFEFKRDGRGALKSHYYAFAYRGTESDVTATADGYNAPNAALSVAFRGDSLVGTFFGTPLSLHRTASLRRNDAPLPKVPRGPGPVWRTALGGAIHAPAAVRDSTVYIGTTGGMFYALRLSDGAFAWSFVAGRPIFGGAATTDSAVFFACDNGYLFKLDRRTGAEVWRYDLGDERASRILTHQVVEHSGDFDFDDRGATPVVADGVVYIGSGDGSMHAVDESKGARLWRFQGKGKIRAAAAIDDRRVYFGTVENMLYAVDRKSGTELWNRDTRGPLLTAPTLIGDRLVIGNRNGLLAGLNPETGATIWRLLLWGSSAESEAAPADGSRFYFGSSDLRSVAYMDATDGKVIWRTDVFGWAWPRPAFNASKVFVSAVGVSPYEFRQLGSFSALDRSTGRILWRWPMPEWQGSHLNGFIASPLVAGRFVVVGGVDGSMYAFPAQ